MPKNDLINAKNNKKDEFYTQLSDIENELSHYKKHFKDKVVFCNCDDPYESNFFKYFALNFNVLGLKKLIAVSYAGSDIIGDEVDIYYDENEQKIKINHKNAYKVIMSELKDVTNDGREDLNDVKELIKNRIRYLKGNGDFRSEESIELLKQADIVVTNPPFSLFREYVAQLMKFDKKFLIIGSNNAITYKEIFPLIKDNKIWLGYGFNGDVGFFRSPYEDKAKSSSHRSGLIRVSGVTWYTNLDLIKRHQDIDLYKKYSNKEYPKYDNYNAIEVSKTAYIPEDYDGVMGVPITFLSRYNPDQFEILGLACGRSEYDQLAHPIKKYENPKQHNPDGSVSNGSKINTGPVIKVNNPIDTIYYTADGTNDTYKVLYARILIRNKKIKQ